MWSPVFECVVGEDGEASYRVGHVLVDEFLAFNAGRARPNTVRAITIRGPLRGYSRGLLVVSSTKLMDEPEPLGALRDVNRTCGVEELGSARNVRVSRHP